MELKRVDDSGVWVLLNSDELLTICNALNEVCNGLDIPEFAIRMGVMREEALDLLKTARVIYEKIAQHT
jgi:hypothetical protein